MKLRILVLVLLLPAGPILAGDGVLEINQTCAQTTGCFPGDGAGFPVRITNPGSYTLTGNLTTTNPNTIAVEVAADGVVVDLNGFEIAGPVTCTQQAGSTVSCTPSGTGVGVDGTSQLRVSVANGSVRGFAFSGVSLGHRSTVRDLKVVSNGGVGINTSVESIVTGCSVFSNDGDGISTEFGSRVEGNVVRHNEGDGISASDSVIRDNSVTFNGGDGIDSPTSVVVDNLVKSNAGYGLRVSGGGYRGNVVKPGTGSTVSGGTELGPNLCDTNTTCP